MKETGGWLSGDILRRWQSKDGSPGHCGLFVVRWEGDPEAPRGFSLRAARLLRGIGMRLAKLTDSVRGWTLSGDDLILAVSFAPEENDDWASGDVSSGRMAFLIRDTAQRLLLEFGTPEAMRPGGGIRCGFGWAAGKDGRTIPMPGSLREWEAALLNAYETALKRMLFSPAPLVRFPLEELRDSLIGFEFEVRYLPIVSLLDGSLYGYEAVPVDALRGKRIELEAFYAQADQSGKLFEWDRRFREAAIRGLPSGNGDVKLFLPVPAKIIFDPRLYPGSTLRRIEAANLRPEHVVLVLIEGDNDSAAMTGSALKHYRNQGFRISIPGIRPELESLRKMADLHPDYARLDVDWIRGETTDAVETSLLQALIALARKEQIVFISGGLDREQLLPGLVASGMHYAQAERLSEDGGGEESGADERIARLQARIRTEVGRKFRGASGTMALLANPVKQFGRNTPVSEASRHFELHREAQGVVISEDGKPVGLLMKEKLLQLLSGQFGLPLYWNRPVGKIMDTHPVIVEESVSVDQASQMAMAREPDKLYDEMIITRDGQVTGTASVRSMLEWVSQARVKDAQWANPLSGLPGNEPIRKEMNRRLAEGRPFAVLYADLDHFKWFNDQFGFQRGDDVIRYTAETLVQSARECPNGDCFVGHIGGDDFIVMSSGMDALEAAQGTIARFEQGSGAYVSAHSGVVLDRSGQPLEAPALSLSLSLLLCRSTAGWTAEALSERAALLKKRAKRQRGNSIAWEELGERDQTEPASEMELTGH
ncbi:EAL domain-containing protein [Cohnella cellulosilytica]|uniref:EAL domain-containing protein n=1 Tax=Cohnella cellulosilytica TaxID=986710 RepID=A0ABW2FD80_9BACL